MFNHRITSTLARFFAVAIIAQLSFVSFVSAEDTIPAEVLKAKEWRFVGPFRGGRVTTVAGVPSNPQLYYMGAAGGGVWKTENAGISWENISDNDFGVGTIGAIAVSLSDPNVIYAGTGEAPIRGVTSSDGDGVYVSTDAGKKWKHVGLDKVGQVSRIRIHPTNPDIAWVAAQGRIWQENPERGIYKTSDGGKTWQHVLRVSNDTGAGELTIDPTNPRILYAAMWQNGRKPWYIKSGGTSGGIFKSADGGDTWKKLEGGLPKTVGKIGVDVVASQPSRVYAVVEAHEGEGGVYRSDDFGVTWKLMSQDRLVQTRAWYYNRVTADPLDPETLYVSNVTFMKSTDGGKTFKALKTPHSDHHDHWINPSNSKNMINANDGGGTVTFDGGKSWSSILNQPTAQFYRVITDNMVPYRIYGGQQDNSTVAVLSRTHKSGIGAEDFYAVGGGESAHIAFDENNPRLIYATTINSTLTEFDTVNKRTRPIKPYPEYVFGRAAQDIYYRTNWNAPVASNPHDPKIIYYGTEKIIRTDDRGVTWKEISPDLTRNDKSRQGLNGGPITNESVGAEYYNTIFYITPSAHEKDVIWVGSDDGLVHITKDEGGTWDNVTPKGAPEGLVNAIEVSPHDAATAYVVIAAYRMGDFKPYIYKTTDYGKKWKRLDKGLPKDTFVRVVREDPDRKGLLYAGTEKGIYVSFDDGKKWQSLKLNLPPVPITDLTLRQGDLIAATQGRGFWVLDDLSLLHQVDGKEMDKALHVFTSRDTLLMRSGSRSGALTAPNPKSGATLHYYLKEEGKGDLSFDVLDAKGLLVRHYSSAESDWDRCVTNNMPPRRAVTIKHPTKKKGMNSWTWDMRRGGTKCIDNIAIFAGYSGASVMPGDFTVRVSVDGKEQSVPLTLLADPRVEAGPEDYAYLTARLDEATGLFNTLLGSIDSLRKARSEIKGLMKEYDDGELHKAGQQAIDKITAWENKVTQVKYIVYEDEDSWPSMYDVQLRHLIDALDRAGPPVAKGSLKRWDDLKAEWLKYEAEMDAIVSGDIKAVNDWAQGRGVNLVRP